MTSLGARSEAINFVNSTNIAMLYVENTSLHLNLMVKATWPLTADTAEACADHSRWRQTRLRLAPIHRDKRLMVAIELFPRYPLGPVPTIHY